MKRHVVTALILSSLAAIGSATADTLTVKNLSVALADSLAESAIEACRASQYTIAVTVVDRAGVPLVIKRMDNAGPHTLEASRMKAYTALSTRNTTENVMKNAQANAGAAHLNDIPGFLLLAGGIPVTSGQEVLGAIGVGGAPGGQLDQQCALDALKENQPALQAG
ncbi:heme-binding protein [Pantoea sp. 1.19]|uniref:GlcG/HbpS family heme-binding protein n=1 Tax=Pantoea sp. 1.19 TaxID=1925589 RepID=UPI000948D5AA|nr:heme-binding protein [Pantoea sp. 1.19]